MTSSSDSLLAWNLVSRLVNSILIVGLGGPILE
jgi:hypothetical protein